MNATRYEMHLEGTNIFQLLFCLFDERTETISSESFFWFEDNQEASVTYLNRAISLAGLFGFDLMKIFKVWPALFQYLSNRHNFYAQLAAGKDKAFSRGKSYPCLTDRLDKSGVAKGHYFHQDLLVAHLVYKSNPVRHMDVGSRVDGFVAHVAVFREIEVFDIRPIASNARNIIFHQKDITQWDDTLYGCTDSLSCLHTLEHFGLGRYGDRVDYNGHRSGFRNLAKMVSPGGKFYFSVPIGRAQRIEFDAHRVFCIPYLLDMFKECDLKVGSFHYVDDAGELHMYENADCSAALETFFLEFGCGIFELIKSPL
jgi:hypothetical protein